MKLRIPLLLFIIGLLSGCVQLFNNNFTMTGFWSSLVTVVFFLIIIGTFFMFEKTGVSERKTHVVTASILIMSAMMFDVLVS